MEWLKKHWAAISAGVAGLIGVLLYMFSSKSKEVASLNAKIDLAKTEKDADVIEAQVNALRADQNNAAKHNEELDKSLQKVQDKRVEVAAQAKQLTDPKAIADYWAKN